MVAVAKFDTWLDASGNPRGNVLQVKRAFYNTPTSFAYGDWTTFPSLEVSITPFSANSKFLIFARVFGEPTYDEHGVHYCIRRNTTQINLGQEAASRITIMHAGHSAYHGGDNETTPTSPTIVTYDTPGTSDSITYTVQVKNQYNNAYTYYYNRTIADADAGSNERGSSELVVMEISY